MQNFLDIEAQVEILRLYRALFLSLRPDRSLFPDIKNLLIICQTINNMFNNLQYFEQFSLNMRMRGLRIVTWRLLNMVSSWGQMSELPQKGETVTVCPSSIGRLSL